jgi:acetyltransferase-like isoleucine patch superfamily enzyme
MKLLRFALDIFGLGYARITTGLWSAIAYLRLWAHGAQVGRGLRVRGALRLHCHRTARIRIGDGCRIHSGFGNPVGSHARMTLWVGPQGSLTLGNRVGLSNSTIVCMDAVSIGDDALVGGDCKIYDTDFHSVRAADRSRPGNPGTRTSPVAISRQVFVGGHSVLLKGVSIGEGAVIGAGSVVRAPVPPGQLWIGNPARWFRDLPSQEAGALRREAAEREEVGEGASLPDGETSIPAEQSERTA